MKIIAKLFTTVILPLAIIAVAVYLSMSLFSSLPTAKRTTAEKLAPLVRTQPVSPEPVQRTIQAYGTVMPAQEITIAPEVSGRILEIHPALQPGGLIKAGETLLRIDPKEYELVQSQAESALEEAIAALEVEQGRQRVAQREWELFGKDMPEADFGRELALREPQLHQAKARIESAKSRVELAKLDLERTVLKAPFDCLVMEETVDVGQQIGPGADAAQLIGTDTFWIQASVPAAQMPVISQSLRDDTRPALVSVYNVGTDTPPVEGHLVRLLGQVDEEGRMAQVLIAIPDPLALQDEHAEQVPIVLNSYMRVHIDGGTLADAVPVPRRGLRENNTLWVADSNSQLQVRSAEVLWSQEEVVAVKNVFEAGDRIIVSPLESALPGMDLRIKEDIDAAALPATGGDAGE